MNLEVCPVCEKAAIWTCGCKMLYHHGCIDEHEWFYCPEHAHQTGTPRHGLGNKCCCPLPEEMPPC